MTHKILLILLLLCSCNHLFSQKTAVPSWRFHSLNQIGLLQGQEKAALQLQSVNGFAFKNIFAGIGVGLDYYQYKSIPLFISFRKYFGVSSNQFFLYADGGVNFVWQKKDDAAYYTETYHPGFYGSGGLGFKTGFKNGMALLLNAGYSYKRITNRQQATICGVIGPCYIQADAYKYDLNRLVMQIGWMF